MTLEEYLRSNNMKLSAFASQYQLNYHRLFRVTQGTVTRDKAIKQVFEQLNIMNCSGTKEGEPNTSFMTQERVCISCERAGEIYCYYSHQLRELEEYLLQQGIPYYVRKVKDYWMIKYDKEAER